MYKQQGQNVYNPVVLALAPHRACVSAVSACAHDASLFVTASADGTAAVYSVLKVQPLCRIHLSQQQQSSSFAHDIIWSPTRPMLLIAATADGWL